MKKFYMTTALISGLAIGAQAQNIDLEGVVVRPADGQSLALGQSIDTAKVLAGIVYNGNGTILGGTGGDGVYFMTSFSRPGTQPGTFYLDGVAYNSDITNADSGKAIFTFPNANKIGAGHTAPYTLSTDSIHVMLNWAKYQNDTIQAALPPFVNGQEYGFFFRAVGVKDANNNPVGTDPNPGNNFGVQRIIWNSTVGVQEFAKKDKATLNLYPNPATNVINFDFDFTTPTHATVIIRDITGKMVYAKNYGRVNAGTQKYSINISDLSAGTYSLEFDTDDKNGVSKFTVK